ncbi:MAG: ATP-binding protein [Deltaproteobacteria bacterium]|jgi:hypothetical protein|nr:ATP-binding protein [Deltaproteobacteria bacterium]
MAQDLPVLPVGWTDFEELRQKNAVYVDKTMYFPKVIEKGKFVFCARPRRFGKSLTLSAFDAFCSGRADLFRGLAVEKDMLSPDFIPRPVIRLNMLDVENSGNKEILAEKILDCLGRNADRHNILLRGADYSNAFSCLIYDIRKESGKKVVLLIDEYDAPVINLSAKEKSAYDAKLLADTRDAIGSFYTAIKARADDIEFAFITGIIKFSGMGVFSKLNNLVDISLDSEFAAFMGYTKQELKSNFSYFIGNTARKLRLSEKRLLKQIRDYYDGFSFDGKKKLYNPFSILSFFNLSKFRKYWMLSGSDGLIKKFLRDAALTVDQFEGMVVYDDFASNPGDIQITSPQGFLYQAGYLTLRYRSGDSFCLEYPNLEVRQAISSLFLSNLILSWDKGGESGEKLGKLLAARDVPGMVELFWCLYSEICYDDHAEADREPKPESFERDVSDAFDFDLSVDELQRRAWDLAGKIKRKIGEGFYRSVLHAALWAAGAKVTPEKHEFLGRPDLEVVCGDLTYVIELKMADDARSGSEAAWAGMSQIRKQKYGRASGTPVRVSIAIGRNERNIVACLFAIDGREMCVSPVMPE